MSFFTKFLSLIILCSLQSFALTAVVQDAVGNPIENVKVTFANDDTTLYTDSTGSFSFSKITPISSMVLSERAKLDFKGSFFSLSLPNSEKVSISLFNIRGQRIMAYNSTMNRGIHMIEVPEMAAGLYLIRASIGTTKITEKFLSQGEFSWTGLERTRTVSSRVSRAVVDTVHFNYSGYAEIVKTIESYDADLGTLVMVKGYDGDWYGFEEFDIDTTLPNFVNILFRAYDQNGYGITGVDTSRFSVLEDGSAITSESELKIEKATTFNDTIRTVMLLDHSKSVEANLLDIKEAAKQMVRNIAPHQEISIYAFSETSTMVSDFTSDTTALIDAISSIPIGYSSTNLYGALLDAFGLISNYASVASKTIMFGNIVLFTDGKDTQGSKTLAQVIAAQGTKQVFSVGLGAELDTAALHQISGDLVYTTSDVSELAGIFEDVQYQISTIANSFYWAHYRSPKRGNFIHTLKMMVEGNSNVGADSSITGTFNSILFQSGWAPTADSLYISLNTAGDSLVGYYVYNDKDGEAEGSSKYRWYFNGSLLDPTSTSIPTSLITSDGKLVFQVLPVSQFGSPQEGAWTSCTLTVAAPIARNLSITLNVTKDTLIGSYEYTDANSDPEGATVIEWYRNDSLINTGSLSILAAGFLEADNLTLRIIPVASSGVILQGDSIKVTKKVVYSMGSIFGGSGVDYATAITPAANGYIITGTTTSYGSGNNDFWAVKVNEDGDTLWTRTYGGSNHDSANSIIPTTDGYIITGNTASYGSGLYDLWGIKINENGDTLWSRRFGGEDNDCARAITSAKDGYIITGYTSSYGAGYYDVWAVKIDENGDTLWTKTYGDTNLDLAYAITPSTNGYIITGHSHSYGSGPGKYNFLVIKINEDGDTLWTQKYGGYDDRAMAYAITHAINGYIITGSINTSGGSTDFWVVKIDEDGNALWSKKYGGTGSDYAVAITPATNGYIIVGSTESHGAGNQDFWVIKIDENGDTLWTNTYGGTSIDRATAIAPATGGYIITGITYSYGAVNGDLWIIRINEDGVPETTMNLK